MTWAINNTAGAAAGANHAAQQRAIDRKKRDVSTPRPPEARDEFLPASATQPAEATRSLKDNSQEEAREDRSSHAVTPSPPDPAGGHLDIRG